MIRFASSLVAAFMICASSTALATDKYVDPVNGNNSNAGTASAPYASITHAISVLTGTGTDNIYCTGGTYNTVDNTGHGDAETFPLQLRRGLSLRRTGLGTPTIGPPASAGDRFVELILSGTPNQNTTVVNGLTFDGGTTNQTAACIYVEATSGAIVSASSNSIDHCTFKNGDGPGVEIVSHNSATQVTQNNIAVSSITFLDRGQNIISQDPLYTGSDANDNSGQIRVVVDHAYEGSSISSNSINSTTSGTADGIFILVLGSDEDEIQAAFNGTVQSNTIQHQSHGIVFRSHDDPSNVADDLESSSSARYASNTIHDCTIDGILLYPGYGNASDQVEGNHLYANSDHGLRIFLEGWVTSKNAIPNIDVFSNKINDNGTGDAGDAGVRVDGSAYVDPMSDIEMYNNRVVANTGYGVYLREVNIMGGTTEGHIKMWNDTIADNSSYGVFADTDGTTNDVDIHFLITNAILWGNNGSGDEYNSTFDFQGWVNYTNLENGNQVQLGGTGNLIGFSSANPDFTDSEYHLGSSSKALDDGDDNASAQLTDFEGNNRKIDVGTSGGNPGIVDRGADERTGT
jgi:hypothetical protein